MKSHKWPNGKGVGTWDESRVVEASVVREEARRSGQSVHFGRIAELLYMKGGELPEGHPDRRLKARDVFLGYTTRDEYMFQLCRL